MTTTEINFLDKYSEDSLLFQKTDDNEEYFVNDSDAEIVKIGNKTYRIRKLKSSNDSVDFFDKLLTLPKFDINTSNYKDLDNNDKNHINFIKDNYENFIITRDYINKKNIEKNTEIIEDFNRIKNNEIKKNHWSWIYFPSLKKIREGSQEPGAYFKSIDELQFYLKHSHLASRFYYLSELLLNRVLRDLVQSVPPKQPNEIIDNFINLLGGRVDFGKFNDALVLLLMVSIAYEYNEDKIRLCNIIKIIENYYKKENKNINEIIFLNEYGAFKNNNNFNQYFEKYFTDINNIKINNSNFNFEKLFKNESINHIYNIIQPEIKILGYKKIGKVNLFITQGDVSKFYKPNEPIKNVVVNAANQTCTGGGGIDGAIHDSANSTKLGNTDFKDHIIQQIKPFSIDVRCTTGNSRVVSSIFLSGDERKKSFGQLNAATVFQAVGPVFTYTLNEYSNQNYDNLINVYSDIFRCINDFNYVKEYNLLCNNNACDDNFEDYNKIENIVIPIISGVGFAGGVDKSLIREAGLETIIYNLYGMKKELNVMFNGFEDEESKDLQKIFYKQYYSVN